MLKGSDCVKNKWNIFFVSVIFVLCCVIALLSCNIYTLSDNNNEATESEVKPNPTEISDIILDVPTLCQLPKLPTGCETVSATMVMNYYDIDITATEFAEKWLLCDYQFIKSGDKTFGPDPNEVFVGDPFEAYGYGCYAPAMEKAINKSELNCKAEVITKKSLDELCSEYVSKGEPVLVWVTLRMGEPKEGESWYIDDDTPFTWTTGEHCMVLVGYNDKYYFFNDPMTGGVVAYKKDLSQQRFEVFGMQSLRLIAE